jgi:hypothetical protein
MAKYRKGVTYAYLVTYAYNPYPMPPGTSKISTATGTVTLDRNKTAAEMMDMIFSYVKEDLKLRDEVTIFPSLYHVEEN